ncbi:lipooligosaccharide transport system ATP-binding protein [Geoalkalibacter ferrihydriticus]|uniref:Lipooligosaccharide transport system ATP-binding protein n=1 Tax=Geoalkalibacter ferrihydriticus TaxID=392333 RepID=A0A1G9T384_9BACT|nr:ATP-binding cassette domain-containing protein [Geoalkalibacter ferrihydriticus]SDM42077.1 lipooligosaccharide transport system ATP-binding protein [Geoalkalibacter ferrihydriticus]
MADAGERPDERWVIEAENLEKYYGTFKAVDGLSFRVKRGECFGLLGPNGAGKTTTIRMLYGYSPMGGGCLRIFGRDLATNLRHIKQRMGICQQEDNLDPDLSVRENLLVYARYFDLPRGEAKVRSEELLRFFALDHRGDANIRELSGGMKRRLMVARAIINRPDLVILDEPTTGLDPQSRHQVWQRLEDLKSRGLTIVLTTHYMDEAARLCDRLVIVDQGKVLVEGAPAALIGAHVGREVIEVNHPDENLRDFLRRKNCAFEDLGTRLLVYNHGADDLFLHLTRDFCPGGCTLRQATLEDVFLRLTGRELRE